MSPFYLKFTVDTILADLINHLNNPYYLYNVSFLYIRMSHQLIYRPVQKQTRCCSSPNTLFFSNSEIYDNPTSSKTKPTTSSARKKPVDFVCKALLICRIRSATSKSHYTPLRKKKETEKEGKMSFSLSLSLILLALVGRFFASSHACHSSTRANPYTRHIRRLYSHKEMDRAPLRYTYILYTNTFFHTHIYIRSCANRAQLFKTERESHQLP